MRGQDSESDGARTRLQYSADSEKVLGTASRMLLEKSTCGAGLGDSMGALLSGLHYVAVTGCRIVVRWDGGLYGERGGNLFPALLRLVQPGKGDIAEVDWASVRVQDWRDAPDFPFGELYGRLREDGGRVCCNPTVWAVRWLVHAPLFLSWDYR